MGLGLFGSLDRSIAGVCLPAAVRFQGGSTPRACMGPSCLVPCLACSVPCSVVLLHQYVYCPGWAPHRFSGPCTLFSACYRVLCSLGVHLSPPWSSWPVTGLRGPTRMVHVCPLLPARVSILPVVACWVFYLHCCCLCAVCVLVLRCVCLFCIAFALCLCVSPALSQV